MVTKQILGTDEDEIREDDVLEEVSFEIDKDAFNKPVKCCNRNPAKISRKIVYSNLEFNHFLWQCPKCKKEYLDFEQAKKLERFWAVQKLLEGHTISMERTMNYDGKAYFFRFPKELTNGWHKGDAVDIKLITPANNAFLVEIRHAHK